MINSNYQEIFKYLFNALNDLPENNNNLFFIIFSMFINSYNDLLFTTYVMIQINMI